MQYIGIDLGSTNLKAAVYDEAFTCLAVESEPMQYEKRGTMVEFDAEKLAGGLLCVLKRLTCRPGVKKEEISRIGLTGQAETLVILGEDDRPLMNAVSWMDERSREECVQLGELFSQEQYRQVTGQQGIFPTWPATKILWLQKNRSDIFEKAKTYMLLKDYIGFFLTGVKRAERSIATFSFYFDIYQKCYWKEMLDAVGIKEEQLPPLTEPCTDLGTITKEVAEETGLSAEVLVNAGTLDHFAGMVGTGNVGQGGMNLSTGTVMALAAIAGDAKGGAEKGIAMHYGFLPDTYVMLPVTESGGVCLEWFRSSCMADVSYDRINKELAQRTLPGEIIFLPYLVGTNAPEFEENASGMFYGLRAENDAFDMAAAVMEGVAFLLRKNCETMRAAGTEVCYIIATGGGAKSDVWCQMQADITGIPVVVPQEKEAACLGAAIIASAQEKTAEEYRKTAEKANKPERRYEPHACEKYEQKYRRFCALYQAMVMIGKM